MRNLCIYHGGCTDGVAAAWAVWSKHPDWIFYPGIYQQEPPWDLIDGASQIVFVDFSYKHAVMLSVVSRALGGTVTVLDHHKTARDDLMPLLDKGTVDGVFDMERCGALIAWDWFHPNGVRPRLLEHIDARDRWIESPPEKNDEVIIALRSYPHSFDPEGPYTWSHLMAQWAILMMPGEVSMLEAQGEGILRYYRARVDETKPHASPIALGPYRGVPCVNAPFYLASDVAGELAADASDGIACV